MATTNRLGRGTAALVTTFLLLTAGCTDDREDGDDGDEASVEDRLAAARATLDDAESIDFSLVTDELPSGVRGLLSAVGTGIPAPAFEGDVTVSVGTSIDAEVIALDDVVYADSAFLPGGFTEVDPALLGAPNPADMFDTETGVSNLLTSTVDPEAGEESRDGEDILTTISGMLPGDLVAALIPTADETGEFAVTYRLTDDDELRDAQISGPFYGDAGDVTYDLGVDPSDEPVDIIAP
ncbi:MAG: LppX_LprAFG lipoprotein [Nocardioidaceae bacterium]|nr:LppX_LprAFG lipoprotein [Nocardioidaceae bacterium]